MRRAAPGCTRCCRRVPWLGRRRCRTARHERQQRHRSDRTCRPGGAPAVRPVHLDDVDVLAGEVAGQADAEAAGALDADAVDGAEAAEPGEQLAVAGRGGGEALGAELVERGGDVDVAVGVDAAGDQAGVGSGDGHGCSLSRGGAATGVGGRYIDGPVQHAPHRSRPMPAGAAGPDRRLVTLRTAPEETSANVRVRRSEPAAPCQPPSPETRIGGCRGCRSMSMTHLSSDRSRQAPMSFGTKNRSISLEARRLVVARESSRDVVRNVARVGQAA